MPVSGWGLRMDAALEKLRFLGTEGARLYGRISQVKGQRINNADCAFLCDTFFFGAVDNSAVPFLI